MLTEDILISEDGFGMFDSDIIRRYTLINKSKASVRLISFGAGIQSINLPNKKGILSDVVLGWDDINGKFYNRMLTKDILIGEDGFGMFDSDIIRRYTLTNKSKASVRLISFGAGIQSINVPNKKGILGDVVLGWDDINGYLENRFMGRTISRVTKAISTFAGDRQCMLSENYDRTNNRHNLNDGHIGFDNVNWNCYIIDKSVVMSHLSNDENKEYPGQMLTQIKYTWTDDNELLINIQATSTRSTVANISNYCLFNLAGQGTGSSELNKHVVTVNSDKWDIDELPIVQSVVGTIFDFRKPTTLSSKLLRQVPGGGINHNFYINSPSTWCYRFHARVLHPQSGRFVEVYSNQPGIYLSTANNLPESKINDLLFITSDHWRGHNDNDDVFKNKSNDLAGDKISKLWGKGGILYKKHSGFSISPHNFLDFKNITHFPSCILHPGNVYQHNMSLKFGVKV